MWIKLLDLWSYAGLLTLFLLINLYLYKCLIHVLGILLRIFWVALSVLKLDNYQKCNTCNFLTIIQLDAVLFLTKSFITCLIKVEWLTLFINFFVNFLFLLREFPYYNYFCILKKQVLNFGVCISEWHALFWVSLIYLIVRSAFFYVKF